MINDEGQNLHKQPGKYYFMWQLTLLIPENMISKIKMVQLGCMLRMLQIAMRQRGRERDKRRERERKRERERESEREKRRERKSENERE